MKRFRALAIMTATAAILTIPGAALAARPGNCVAQTVQTYKSTFSMDHGSAAVLVAQARAGTAPWCW